MSPLSSLSDSQFEQMFQAMSRRLEERSSDFAFIQARVSAESFVRDECARAASDFLRPSPYHVHMEKKLGGKKIDLLIVPIEGGREEWSRACGFEVKMAWPGAPKGNAPLVRKDLDRLRESGTDSWALVLYFAIISSVDGMPYKPRKVDFKHGLEAFIRDLGEGDPPFRSKCFLFSHEGVSGNAVLLAWKAST